MAELADLTTADLRRKYFLAGLAGDLPGGGGGDSDLVVDETVGKRVLLGTQMVFGDTGWRALCRWASGAVTEGTIPSSGITPAASSAGGIFVRRVNNIVSVAVVEANATAANPEINSVPLGFRGNTTMPYPAVPFAFYTSTAVKMGMLEVGTNLYRFRGVSSGDTFRAGGSGGYGVTASFITDVPWPTVLPGTAA